MSKKLDKILFELCKSSPHLLEELEEYKKEKKVQEKKKEGLVSKKKHEPLTGKTARSYNKKDV